MIQFFKNHSLFFLLYLIFLVVGGIILATYSKTEIFLFINQTNHYTSDYFFRYYTNVGDGIFYGLVVVILLFYKYKYAITAALSFAATSLIAQLLKRLVFTDAFRPYKFFQGSGVEFHMIEGVKLYSNNSFPSGHSTTAFSIFCLLALLFPDRKYGFMFFVLALMGAYSRVYVGQHFFADIYAGSVIGVVFTLLIFYGMERYFKRLGKEWPEKRLGGK